MKKSKDYEYWNDPEYWKRIDELTIPYYTSRFNIDEILEKFKCSFNEEE